MLAQTIRKNLYITTCLLLACLIAPPLKVYCQSQTPTVAYSQSHTPSPYLSQTQVPLPTMPPPTYTASESQSPTSAHSMSPFATAEESQSPSSANSPSPSPSAGCPEGEIVWPPSGKAPEGCCKSEFACQADFNPSCCDGPVHCLKQRESLDGFFSFCDHCCQEGEACCGDSCMPNREDVSCCSSQNRFCENNEVCCGNTCAPEGATCCSDEGDFCPEGQKCCSHAPGGCIDDDQTCCTGGDAVCNANEECCHVAPSGCMPKNASCCLNKFNRLCGVDQHCCDHSPTGCMQKDRTCCEVAGGSCAEIWNPIRGEWEHSKCCPVYNSILNGPYDIIGYACCRRCQRLAPGLFLFGGCLERTEIALLQ